MLTSPVPTSTANCPRKDFSEFNTSHHNHLPDMKKEILADQTSGDPLLPTQDDTGFLMEHDDSDGNMLSNSSLDAILASSVTGIEEGHGSRNCGSSEDHMLLPVSLPVQTDGDSLVNDVGPHFQVAQEIMNTLSASNSSSPLNTPSSPLNNFISSCPNVSASDVLTNNGESRAGELPSKSNDLISKFLTQNSGYSNRFATSSSPPNSINVASPLRHMKYCDQLDNRSRKRTNNMRTKDVLPTTMSQNVRISHHPISNGTSPSQSAKSPSATHYVHYRGPHPPPPHLGSVVVHAPIGVEPPSHITLPINLPTSVVTVVPSVTMSSTVIPGPPAEQRNLIQHPPPPYENGSVQNVTSPLTPSSLKYKCVTTGHTVLSPDHLTTSKSLVYGNSTPHAKNVQNTVTTKANYFAPNIQKDLALPVRNTIPIPHELDRGLTPSSDFLSLPHRSVPYRSNKSNKNSFITKTTNSIPKRGISVESKSIDNKPLCEVQSPVNIKPDPASPSSFDNVQSPLNSPAPKDTLTALTNKLRKNKSKSHLDFSSNAIRSIPELSKWHKPSNGYLQSTTAMHFVGERDSHTVSAPATPQGTMNATSIFPVISTLKQDVDEKLSPQKYLEEYYQSPDSGFSESISPNDSNTECGIQVIYKVHLNARKAFIIYNEQKLTETKYPLRNKC